MTLELIARAFIVFGLAHMFVDTDGPGGLFKAIKRLAGVTYAAEFDGYGQKIGEVEEANGQLGKLVTCFYCFSFWVCAIASLFRGEYDQTFLLVYGMASFLYRMSDGKIRS